MQTMDNKTENEFIGRPYNDTGGTIKEILINYNPAAHHTIREVIKAMPHVKFIVFDGPDKEDLDKIITNKLENLLLKEKNIEILEEWKRRFKGPYQELINFYDGLIKRKISSSILDSDYLFLKNFLEMAGLCHYRINFNYQGLEGLSANKLKEEYPEQIELIKVDYVIGNFARDAIIALYDADKRIIIPSNQGISTDIIGQIDMRYTKQADNLIWKERGYERRDGLKVKQFVGGQVVANKGHIFIGMNPFEESIINDGPYACSRDIRRIESDAKLFVYRDPEIYDHIDVMLMPINERELFLSDPIETKNMLEKYRIKIWDDIGLMNSYMDFYKQFKKELENRGFTINSAPFWLTDYRGAPAMLTYCNSLQEENKIYSPQRGARNESKRLMEMGKIMDNWFYEIASKYKEVVPIPGFEIPSAWKDAGLRCLANVVWRE